MSGQTATLTVVATGSETIAYQWYQGSSGDASSPVGTDSASFTTPALTQTTSYWVRVSNGCGTPADSDTATVSVCTLACSTSVQAIGTAGLAVAFTGSATVTGGCTPGILYDWNFGDGTAHSGEQNPSHTYASAGSYAWTLTVTAGTAICTKTGTLTVVNGPANLIMKKKAPSLTILVTGTNLQSGVRAFIDGTEWTSTTYKAPKKLKPAKLKLTGGKSLKAAVPKGTQKTFRFLNPDGGEAFMTWGW
jgi:PKD repeat protein